MLRCYQPLGPLILTVSCPAPAPRVSQMKRDWNVARTPCSIPGPYTRTLLGSGAPATRKENGLPGTWSPDTNNGDTDKHRNPSKNSDTHIYQLCTKSKTKTAGLKQFLKRIRNVPTRFSSCDYCSCIAFHLHMLCMF